MIKSSNRGNVQNLEEGRKQPDDILENGSKESHDRPFTYGWEKFFQGQLKQTRFGFKERK